MFKFEAQKNSFFSVLINILSTSGEQNTSRRVFERKFESKILKSFFVRFAINFGRL